MPSATPDLPPLLRIGARPSRLALIQAQAWLETLAAQQPRLPKWAIRPIASRGDIMADRPLWEIGGRELFVGALQAALLGGEIDVAVHSLKDMPHQQPDGLVLAAILRRDSPLDMLVAKPKRAGFAALPAGARIGTASPRRLAQLRHFSPHLVPVPLRGNVDTRVKKVMRGEVAGVLLAEAGLQRLGLADAGVAIPAEQLLPAAGQGALALEVRAGDKDLRALLAGLHHASSAACVMAERAFTRAFGGSCQVAVAALGEIVADGRVWLRAQIFPPTGGVVAHERVGAVEDAESLGRQAAAAVKQQAGDG